jgi:hypothetical protein
MSNVGPEFAVTFQPRPNDPAWRGVTEINAAAYQLWFQRIWWRADLRECSSTAQLTSSAELKMVEIANEAHSTHGLNIGVLLLVCHQFMDADPMMRGIHTTCWVAKMMERPDWAMQAEDYVRLIHDKYFMSSPPPS